MSKTPQPATQPTSVFEELHRTDLVQWQSVVSRVQDPVTARLVVQFLDANPQLMDKRAGVYLAAADTVQRDQIRLAKSYRKGRAAALVVMTLWKMGKAVTGLVRSATRERQAEALQVKSPTATAPAPAAVSKVEPARGFDHLVFPVIVDPFAGKATLVH